MGGVGLGAALLLDRFATTGSPAAFRVSATLLGLCILTKQTSAWLLVGALAWLIFVRRERLARVASFLAWGSLPYAIFAVSWGLIFRTTSHIYWTLLIPLGGHASEIVAFSAAELK